MSTFQTNSEAFQKQLADAARWMIRRNAGHDHYWRWQVLTSVNQDREASRPVFDNQTAQSIFQQLESKKLIVPIQRASPPAYLMVYDMTGWENAIADGRPLLGLWFRFRRKWCLHILTFAAGVAVGALKSEAIDFTKSLFHQEPVQFAPKEPIPK